MYRGLHEVAHVTLGHVARRQRRRWQLEAEAEAWTQRRMRELGFAPARCITAGEAYVARMQQWGTAISRANAARHASGLPSTRRA
jgi:hypothetical protein